LQRWSRLGLVGLGSGFHALVSFRQCPELTRELGAIDEVWLVVVWATVENVQTLAGAAKLRRQPDAVAVLRYHDVPELAREVAAIYEMRLVVVGAAVENVQAHVSTPVFAQSIDPSFYYKLSTQFRGNGMKLDVFNGGPKNNMTRLEPDQDVSGQFWRFEGNGDGTFRLSTLFRGPGSQASSPATARSKRSKLGF
jgi:hypothetical protein